MAFGATLVDGRLLGLIANFFPSLCTVRDAAVSASSYGETERTWADVAGVVSVACRIAPASQQEPLNVDLEYAVATHTAVLQGYYSDVKAKMRAVVDSVTYDITGVSFDDQALQTRLDLREVDP